MVATAVIALALVTSACNDSTDAAVERAPTTSRPGVSSPVVESGPSGADVARCEAEVQAQLDALTDVDLSTGIYRDYARTSCAVAGPEAAPTCVEHAIRNAAEASAGQTGPPEVTISESAQRASLLATCVIGSMGPRGGP